MKSSFLIIAGAIITAVLFFSTTFFSLSVKHEKNEIKQIYQDIEKMELDIKRLDIDIAALKNPLNTIRFIKKNGYIPVKVDDITIIYVKK